jgi:antitoxin MazE
MTFDTMVRDVKTFLKSRFQECGMTEAVLDIKQWGNNLRADHGVRVSVEDGQVVIRPVADTTISLEQRLARFDPARHGGEVMAGRLGVVHAGDACLNQIIRPAKN